MKFFKISFLMVFLCFFVFSLTMAQDEEFGFIGKIEEFTYEFPKDIGPLFVPQSELEKQTLFPASTIELKALNIGFRKGSKYPPPKWDTWDQYIALWLYTDTSTSWYFYPQHWLVLVVINYGAERLRGITVEMQLEGPTIKTIRKKNRKIKAETVVLYAVKIKLSQTRFGLYKVTGTLKDKKGNEIDQVITKFFIHGKGY